MMPSNDLFGVDNGRTLDEGSINTLQELIVAFVSAFETDDWFHKHLIINPIKRATDFRLASYSTFHSNSLIVKRLPTTSISVNYRENNLRLKNDNP